MNNSVAILLSTYNGEKYIKEQMDSLLAQTYPNIKIYIRDDCSTDNTLEILKTYEDDRIVLIEGEKNLGYPGGFYELLRRCDEEDFYSFCDQYDVWLPEKIERAVDKLKDMNEATPNLYYAGYDFYDSQLNYIKPCPKIKHNPEFR